MLKVRLQRVGRKNDPSFRVVVVDSQKGPKTGKYLEMVGSYNPRQKKVSLDGERVKHWIAQGAQVSDTVHNILISEKVIEGKKVNVLPKKSPIVKEPAKEEAKAEKKEEAAADVPAEEMKAEASVEPETPAEAEKEDAPAPTKEEKKEEPESAPAEKIPAESEVPTEESEETKKEETA